MGTKGPPPYHESMPTEFYPSPSAAPAVGASAVVLQEQQGQQYQQQYQQPCQQQFQQGGPVIVMNQPAAASPVVVVQQAPVARTKNYMCLSIFTCLCCFWPLGLIAVVLSCMAQSHEGDGDLEGARKFSRIALWLNIGAIVAGLVTVGIIAAVSLTSGDGDDY